jgi:glc operon protein GlcG
MRIRAELRLLAPILIAVLACGASPVRSAEPAATSLAALPISLAIKAAKIALAECVGQGLTPVVTVTDRDGIARVVLVSDGADPVGIIASRRKAYTSAALGVTSEQFKTEAQSMTLAPKNLDPQLITFAGGIPLVRRGVVVGAIGVGGADRDGDAPNVACAQAGAASIKDQLDQLPAIN